MLRLGQHGVEIAVRRIVEHADDALITFTQVMISVVPIPDSPEIVLPTIPVVEEDGELIVSGLGVYDADVSRPGDEDLLFDVWLEAISGRLSLNGSTVS